MPGARLYPTPEQAAALVEQRTLGLRWDEIKVDPPVCSQVLQRWCREIDPRLCDPLPPPVPTQPPERRPVDDRLKTNSMPLAAGHPYTWGVISDDPWPGPVSQESGASAPTGRGAGHADGQGLRPKAHIIPTAEEKAKAVRVFWNSRRMG